MAHFHVDLDATGTSGDGSTWNDDSSGTAVFVGIGGFEAAFQGAAAGDFIYVKGDSSEAVGMNGTGAADTIAATTNPIRVYGVKTGTTNLGASIVESDLIPGIRTGQSTRAYDWGGGTVPHLNLTGSSDFINRQSAYFYGIRVTAADEIFLASGVNNDGPLRATWEECEITVSGGGDHIEFGGNGNDNFSQQINLIHSRIDAGAGSFQGNGPVRVWAFDTIFDNTNATNAWGFIEWTGRLCFEACDFVGIAGPLFNISDIHGGEIFLFNCDMPASHTLTTGTATNSYRIENWGSDDTASLGSSASERQLEIITNEGTVDIEETRVRTNGADDGASGDFSWALDCVDSDANLVGVVSPWMGIWVEGDGTAKTLDVFIANDSASTDLQDDEVYLEIIFPSEAGDAKHDYRPNEEAGPTTFGRANLLASAANLTDDTGSTWGSGANNHQKLTATIDPDYQGLVRCRVWYTKPDADNVILYVDPNPEIS